MATLVMIILSFTSVLMMTPINAASTKCSSDSDCASDEGCLPLDKKCYHRFNVSDFSVLKLIALGTGSWYYFGGSYSSDDSSNAWHQFSPDTDSDSPEYSDITVFRGDALSPIFDGDLSTSITAANGTYRPKWYISLSFPADRWVNYMKLVLSEPTYVTTSGDLENVQWSVNAKDGLNTYTEIENGKYQSHTFKNYKAKVPSAVHDIRID
eukprot:565577_1